MDRARAGQALVRLRLVEAWAPDLAGAVRGLGAAIEARAPARVTADEDLARADLALRWALLADGLGGRDPALGARVRAAAGRLAAE